MRKGFVTSLDSLVALMLLFTLLTAVTANLDSLGNDANNSELLKQAAMDSLTVLDKSGRIERAVSEGSPGTLRAFLNRLPYSICADLRVYSESDLEKPVFTVLRQDCKKNFTSSAIAKRTALAKTERGTEIYLAELRAWQRVKG